jgi:hypothetical protein
VIKFSGSYEEKQRKMKRRLAIENPYLEYDWCTGELKLSELAKTESERIKKQLEKALDKL